MIVLPPCRPASDEVGTLALQELLPPEERVASRLGALLGVLVRADPLGELLLAPGQVILARRQLALALGQLLLELVCGVSPALELSRFGLERRDLTLRVQASRFPPAQLLLTLL